MGLDLSAFMLEGDHVRDAPAIVTGLGCRVEDTLTEVDGEAWASGRFNDGYYTVQLRGNWTILVGPDGDPIGEEEK